MIFKSLVSAALLLGHLKFSQSSNSAGYTYTNDIQDCLDFTENFEYTIA